MEKELPVAKPEKTMKEKVLDILFARRKEFYETGCNAFETKEMTDAANIIKRLIPPEKFISLDKVIQSEMAEPGETVYRKVSVKERLPKALIADGRETKVSRGVWALTASGKPAIGYFTLPFGGFVDAYTNEVATYIITHWLEEITLPAQQSWPSEEVKEGIEAIEWAMKNMKPDRPELQSDSFNILANALEGLKKSQQKGG